MRSSTEKTVASAAALLPNRLLHFADRAAQLGQGKGWGANTVAPEVAAAVRLLGRNAGDSVVALDIGANVGDWTAALLSALPDVRVYSFEPSSVAHAKLAARFASDPRVQALQTAVGGYSGSATLWSPSPGSVLGSLDQRDVAHFGQSFDHSEEVAVTTLDDWLEGAGVHPTLVKMDVEGRELDVLRMAPRALGSARVVQFEFGPPNVDSRTYFRDFWNFFREAGFTVFRLTPRGLARVAAYHFSDETFLTTNYFAIPNP